MKIKSLLFPLARGLGFFELTRYIARRYPIILVYHRFGPRAKNPFYTSVGAFETQIRMLKRKFNLLSLRQLSEYIESAAPIPANSVVLTVDDGYEDFYTYALPVLKEYAVPATVFVVTDFINGKAWLWPDRIAFIIKQTNLDEVSLDFSGVSVRLGLRTWGEKRQAWGRVADHALELPDTECRRFIDDLSGRFAVEFPERPPVEYRPMSWPQVVEACRAGVEIGSHSCTHPRLTRVDNRQLFAELKNSKVDIEANIQEECRAFCYPFGRKMDISDLVQAAVEQVGYRYATIGYFNLEVTSERYALKRLGAGGNLPDFIKKVHGWEVLQTFFRNRPYDR